MSASEQPPVLKNTQQGNDRQQPYEDEIDLLELWRALWQGKWIVLALTMLFSIGAVFYALSLPNMYKSTALLAPAESKPGSAGVQLAGLASIAGINLGGDSNLANEAMQIVGSWAFIEEFIQEQEIAPLVFALKGWDKATNSVIFDTTIYDPTSKAWIRTPAEGQKAQPSSWELYKVFSQRLMTEKDDKTGFYSISVEAHSPDLAKQWVEGLLSKLNRHLKERDKQKAVENIDFLRRQVAETNLAGMQTVFYRLIEDQTKSLMLASGSDDYVFRVVNAPRAPEEKSAPSRSVICIVSALLGFFIGVFWALVRYKIYRRRLLHAN